MRSPSTSSVAGAKPCAKKTRVERSAFAMLYSLSLVREAEIKCAGQENDAGRFAGGKEKQGGENCCEENWRVVKREAARRSGAQTVQQVLGMDRLGEDIEFGALGARLLEKVGSGSLA